ncbi:GPW/gp25 family protein [Paenibacillaceae bacterium WGS1546]|uniref:GPW/gp25 family protein n=1 Tax=Cohnella sp. WGS1546 TaxID=3366810 RepID=UPI00372CFBAC
MSAPFLGRGWKFPVQVDATTGRMRMSEGEDDIAEAIRIILLTAKGERVMRPGFGSGLRDFVFRTMDGTTITQLQNDLERAITVWEPRVRDVEVRAAIDPSRPGQLQLRIRYVVRSTNNLFNQVYPFYLDEGTK